jgi:hypothetical protein
MMSKSMEEHIDRWNYGDIFVIDKSEIIVIFSDFEARVYKYGGEFIGDYRGSYNEAYFGTESGNTWCRIMITKVGREEGEIIDLVKVNGEWRECCRESTLIKLKNGQTWILARFRDGHRLNQTGEGTLYLINDNIIVDSMSLSDLEWMKRIEVIEGKVITELGVVIADIYNDHILLNKERKTIGFHAWNQEPEFRRWEKLK